MAIPLSSRVRDSFVVTAFWKSRWGTRGWMGSRAARAVLRGVVSCVVHRAMESSRSRRGKEQDKVEQYITEKRKDIKYLLERLGLCKRRTQWQMKKFPHASFLFPFRMSSTMTPKMPILTA